MITVSFRYIMGIYEIIITTVSAHLNKTFIDSLINFILNRYNIIKQNWPKPYVLGSALYKLPRGVYFIRHAHGWFRNRNNTYQRTPEKLCRAGIVI